MAVTLRQKPYPSKTAVNLIVKERSARRAAQAVCFLLVLAVLVGIFCKFGVIDRLNAASEAQAQASAAQAELERLRADNADFETVRVEYARYFSSDLTGEAGAADCMEVLGLLESGLMPRAGIASASFSGRLLSVQLTGINLDGASALLADLYRSPIVGNVEIYTADADVASVPDENSTVSMTITLLPGGGDGT